MDERMKLEKRWLKRWLKMVDDMTERYKDTYLK